MKLFSDVEDGEVFCLSSGLQLVKVTEESTMYNACKVVDSNVCCFISPETETFTPEEMFENSTEEE